MHYIVGTYFLTPTRLGTSENDRKLSPNTQYSLIYIQKEKEGGAIYTLLGSDRKKIDLKFSTCREADKFIARFKRENIPDYDATYTQRLESESADI
jgi:hypothetical protein